MKSIFPCTQNYVHIKMKRKTWPVGLELTVGKGVKNLSNYFIFWSILLR